MPVALLLLGVALAANVVFGPLGFGVLVWRVSALGLNQTYGADAASLALIVPSALAGAWLWRARHPLAAPLALGAGLVTLYYAVAETLGGDDIRYAGNNERFFLLFLALIILSWTIAVRAWAALDAEPLALSPWLARSLAVVMLLGGGLIGLAWTAQLVPMALGSGPGPEFLDSPSAYWTIRIVDLGFIAPVSLWTGVGLLRRNPEAVKAACALSCFLTLQGASVLAMGFVMLWRLDPTASPVLVYALTPIVLALAALTTRLLAAYVGDASAEGTGHAARRVRSVSGV